MAIWASSVVWTFANCVCFYICILFAYRNVGLCVTYLISWCNNQQLSLNQYADQLFDIPEMRQLLLMWLMTLHHSWEREQYNTTTIIISERQCVWDYNNLHFRDKVKQSSYTIIGYQLSIWYWEMDQLLLQFSKVRSEPVNIGGLVTDGLFRHFYRQAVVQNLCTTLGSMTPP